MYLDQSCVSAFCASIYTFLSFLKMAESVEMHDVGNIPNDDGSNGHGENAGKMDGKVDVSKTGRDAAEMKKLKLFCVILLVMIIVSSGTIGALIYTLVS